MSFRDPRSSTKVQAIVQGTDFISGNSGIDASTEALYTIDYPHHEIHSGSHYFISSYEDLALNNVLDLQITTPNTTAWLHFLSTVTCEFETNVQFYENVTISTAGTAMTPRNNNRNSSNTSGATFARITNTSVANANADTAVAGATLLEDVIVGAGRTSGGSSRELELILKQNTKYTLRFIATVAGFSNFLLSWYEHTSKN